MTQFFNFSDLTWPEVKALSRRTPLVLPLGEGYEPEELGGVLGNPPQAGLLPAIPYGWAGSSLEIEQDLVARMVRNLLAGLGEDGFEQVFALVPPCTGLESGPEWLCLRARKTTDPTTAWPAGLDGSRVVLIPVGHTEQHGYHLPLSTDTIIIEAISQATAGAHPDLALSLPVMPYGVSTHRASFQGTLNTGGRAFEDFWLGVIDSLAGRGVRMVYLMSGHGGNCSFLTNVVKYAGERHPQVFCATAWLYLSGPEGVAALEKYRKSARGGMGHACELETALLLHLAPGLVHMERVIDETNFITTPSYYMDWVEGGALVANPPWRDDTTSGAYGAGSLATPENGKIWLEAAVLEKAAHVKEILEQQHRRTARRKERGL